MIDTHQGLPHEAADSITKPFARFLKIEAAAGGLLFLYLTGFYYFTDLYNFMDKIAY